MDIHSSARRHGLADDDIRHAIDYPLVVVDLEPEADPPKLLLLGPDVAGNILEVIILLLADDRSLGGRRSNGLGTPLIGHRAGRWA